MIYYSHIYFYNYYLWIEIDIIFNVPFFFCLFFFLFWRIINLWNCLKMILHFISMNVFHVNLHCCSALDFHFSCGTKDDKRLIKIQKTIWSWFQLTSFSKWKMISSFLLPFERTRAMFVIFLLWQWDHIVVSRIRSSFVVQLRHGLASRIHHRLKFC